MKYMVIQLYDPRCLDDLMLALTAHDVRDAVVLDGQAVGSALTEDIPIFAGFRVDLGEKRGATKLVLAVVSSDETARAIRNELKDTGINLDHPATAKVLLLPVEELG
jgi:hypothetical protein